MTSRIGIFGSYDTASQGDLAILWGILTQIQRRFPQAQFTVFALDPSAVTQAIHGRFDAIQVVPARPGTVHSAAIRVSRGGAKPNPSRARKLRSQLASLPWLYDVILVLRYLRFWQRLREYLRDLDLLLIGGGGLLVDLYARWPIYPLLYTWLARATNTRVMFYAVGVGPIHTTRGRWYFRWAVQHSQGITVRDRYSYEQARQILGIAPPRLVQAADPAFVLKPVRPTPREERNRPRIGVSTVAIYRPPTWPKADPVRYQTYIQRMATLVAQIANRYQAHVILFSTNCPQDLLAAEDIQRTARPLLQRGTLDIFPTCNLDKLFTALYPNLDLVLGTRLHSLILALIHHIPIVALAYQEKVMALGEELELQEITFPLEPLTDPNAPSSDTTQEAILAAVETVWKQRDVYHVRVRAGVQRMRQAAERSVTMLAKILATPRA
ncbi:MAG: hypothetical protein GXO54_04520 [Chloroflexi bacterium]|nr:hypothetical protein [Chloroflexota bacterium]